jgi:hypothetical protein
MEIKHDFLYIWYGTKYFTASDTMTSIKQADKLYQICPMTSRDTKDHIYIVGGSLLT